MRNYEPMPMKHTQTLRKLSPPAHIRDASGKPITYQEWDVNSQAPGRDRDAERIITGSDGSAGYATDHYHTFYRIR